MLNQRKIFVALNTTAVAQEVHINIADILKKSFYSKSNLNKYKYTKYE